MRRAHRIALPPCVGVLRGVSPAATEAIAVAMAMTAVPGDAAARTPTVRVSQPSCPRTDATSPESFLEAPR